MKNVTEKFLKYVSFDTMSADEAGVIPSTDKQWDLARFLYNELIDMGAQDVTIDEHAYVFATIPANTNKPCPTLGLIAHMDTSPAYSDTNVKPIRVNNYDGGDILMNPNTGLTLSPDDFPSLLNYIGKDIITTDGTTLLGADDKAGIAEIMALSEYLIKNPDIKHGKIRIGFTPDEEVGCGADEFNVEAFGADVAYTIDGGALGEIEYENFNAASGKVIVHGSSIHPGDAKGKMKNAILIGMEFESLLPVFQKPMYTCGYEGFFHLDGIRGNVEECTLDYIIRDHDASLFDRKCELFHKAGDWINEKYGKGTVEVHTKESYRNMKEKILPHMYLIDIAKSAMESVGASPDVIPIRGGTDGARLSYMGLPCPNLSTGGHNFHGKFEYICVQSMERMCDVILNIVKSVYELDK